MTIRLTGTVSGLDVDSLVKAQTSYQQEKIDKLTDKKTTTEWTREAYQEINSSLLEFRNTTLQKFNMSSTLQARSTTLSGDTEAITAKAAGAATIGTIRISVQKLATSTTKVGNTDIRKDSTTSFKPSETLSSQSSYLGSGTTLSSSYSFSINGTTIEVDTASDSLEDVMDKINDETDVNAYYDEESGRISLSSKDTGKSSTIELSDTDGFLEDVLMLGSSNVTDTAGQDAEVVINGIETTRSSNTFSVNGASITLNKTSEATTDTPASASDYVTSVITVAPDTESIVSSIKDFVDNYNTLLAALQTKVTEEKYSDYTPLSDDEMSEMTETQITEWNKYAKSGLLRNDEYLRSAINSMRYSASSIINNGSDTYNTLASIGIETGDYSEQGKLYVDEDTLTAAIEDDPDAVASIFNLKSSDKTDTTTPNNGVTTAIYNSMYTTLQNISTKAGTSIVSSSASLSSSSVLGQLLTSLENQIDDENDRLTDLENYYYDIYADMETTLNTLQTQSSALSNLNS